MLIADITSVVCGMGIGLLGRESQQRWSDFLLLGGLIGIASCIKDKGMKVVDANETPMNEFVFAYIGSTNLPTDSSPGGLLTLGFMDGSSSCKLQFFFRHDNVFKRIQWYNNWQNWTKILTE